MRDLTLNEDCPDPETTSERFNDAVDPPMAVQLESMPLTPSATAKEAATRLSFEWLVRPE
jgi:hypothetical protein